jgi:hypothetical protein
LQWFDNYWNSSELYRIYMPNGGKMAQSGIVPKLLAWEDIFEQTRKLDVR